MGNLTELFIPFPPQLMSSARAPSKMPMEFAREIVNMYMRQDGAGSKRNGCTAIGDALEADINRLMHYIKGDGTVQILAATADGKIYLKDGSTWQEVYSGLDTDGTIRWTHFAGRLVICNGVDDLISWDGTSFSIVQQSIVDAGANLTYLTPTTFSIESDAAFYQPGTTVQARLGGSTYVNSTVASVSGAGTITVVLNDTVLTNVLNEVSFTAKPPKFAYVYPAHDRLWGFGEGPLQPDSFGTDVDRSRIYYTAGLNDETAWRDTDGLLQSINIADKMPVLDEVMAMGVKDGLTVFFCRNHTQVWSGFDPTATGDFSWVKTLPLGVVHGDLVVDLPNDVGFFTRYGARTLSRTLQTEQLDIGDFGAEIDPTLGQAVNSMLQNVANYRQVEAFKYDAQGWFGFKPASESLVFQISGSGRGWTVFKGLFASATAFLNTPDGKLYLASGGQLYEYDESVWADGTAAIETRWWTPWLNVGNNFKRWANKVVEVISDQGAVAEVMLRRFKNYDSSSFIQNSVTASVAADYWDDGEWDNGLWDNGVSKPELKRDHFVADVFSYAIESNNTAGPITLFGLKIRGVKEQ
ncbi:MAG: hypothetical protein OXR68_04275 [Alphaproteobacteria bacterium]|nr:hypothetical protein [Alphaproteobacteria bacterium]MDD9919824.1 hypothetical protein [Alphaproteobacteria bacterium]